MSYCIVSPSLYIKLVQVEYLCYFIEKYIDVKKEDKKDEAKA